MHVECTSNAIRIRTNKMSNINLILSDQRKVTKEEKSLGSIENKVVPSERRRTGARLHSYYGIGYLPLIDQYF